MDLAFPSGCTILRPICLSTVNNGSSQITCSLTSLVSQHITRICLDSRGKLPFTSCHVFLLHGTVHEFIREGAGKVSIQRYYHETRCQSIQSIYRCGGQTWMRTGERMWDTRPTVYFVKVEFVSEHFDKTVSVISSRCVYRLWSSSKLWLNGDRG